MTTFVDTSAFLALLVGEDRHHGAASEWLRFAAAQDEVLVTHSYVIVESIALIHRRLGPALTRAFIEDLLPVCELRFIDEPLHARATSAFVAALGRRPSFVDRVSFELMRGEGIRRAFAFDPHFSREGFETVP